MALARAVNRVLVVYDPAVTVAVRAVLDSDHWKRHHGDLSEEQGDSGGFRDRMTERITKSDAAPARVT
eukprot:15099-Eustigmatos_ZCMA.PRE.1